MTAPSRSRFFPRAGWILFSLGGFLLLAFFAAWPASASPQTDVLQTPTPTISPTPAFDQNRLKKPLVHDPLTQLDEGALEYWGVCMACHSDKGQGLTDEWRHGAYGEDFNCWGSKCHASNHPPQGFEFPRIVPPVAGAGALARFVNARQLYEYNIKNMPWWDPGQLTQEKAWAVTAYILKLNGTLPEGVVLSSSNADLIPVSYVVQPPSKEQPWAVALAGILLLSALGLAAQAVASRRGVRPNFILHLHPPTIPALQARFRHTLAAGGLAVFFSLVLAVTGLLEMYYYIPSTDRAAQSVQEIAFLVPHGGLVRNLHFWAAQALVATVTVHLLRVIFTGAYHRSRRFNYLLGLGLLVIALLLDFTGYILRWDDGIHWALIAGTNLLASIPKIGESLVQFISGGTDPGPTVLIHYYTWHIFGLTILGGLLMIWHLFRVRRDGGIAAPKSERKTVPPTSQIEEALKSEPPVPSRISRRQLLHREVIAMLVAAGGLILLATFLAAPIDRPIDPTLVSLSEPSAPWIFLWVQQLLKLGDPFLLGVAVPLLVLALLASIPYLFPHLNENEIGRWFPRSGRAAQILAAILVIALTSLTLLAILSKPIP